MRRGDLHAGHVGPVRGETLHLDLLRRLEEKRRRLALAEPVGRQVEEILLLVDADAVLDKLGEETAELRAELHEADPDRIEDEIGDMFFVMVNLARKLGCDAEAALARANAKFERRFRAVEAALAADGRAPRDAGIEAMETLWQAVKRRERAEAELRTASEALAAAEQAHARHPLREAIPLASVREAFPRWASDELADATVAKGAYLFY